MSIRFLIEQLFQWIYYLLSISLVWFIGLFIGLGIFGSLPASASVFYLWQLIRRRKDFYRIHIFSSWWQFYKKEIKRSWWLSAIMSIIYIMIWFNLYFFHMTVGFLSYLMYYLTLFILAIYPFIFLWIAYIRANDLTKSYRVALSNATFLLAASLIESVILLVFSTFILIVLENLSIALLLLIAPALLLLLVDWAYTKIIDGQFLLNYLKR